MARKGYKKNKRGAGRFVQLHHWVMQTEAWRTMKPGPRALFVELKRRFNGTNNGRITLSHREAAALLNVSRNTVAAYFETLMARGFIRMVEAPCLGPDGQGRTARWALEDEPMPGGGAPSKSFTRWQEKPPAQESAPPHRKTARAENSRFFWIEVPRFVL
ncbi:MAG: hypothetical protein AAFO57_00785 [Pseudomonadota bacterium]